MDRWFDQIRGRLETNASHVIPENITVAISEMKAPDEEMAFQA